MRGGLGGVGLARSPRAVITEFFDRFRAHDIEGMAALCSTHARFHCVPFEVWGRQRVQRAEGTVHGIGKAFWHGLVSSFPDLALSIHTVTANDDGDVVVQAVMSGTQYRPWGRVAPTGRRFVEAHLFILHVGADQLIDDITAYWNEASIAQQLGHHEVD